MKYSLVTVDFLYFNGLRWWCRSSDLVPRVGQSVIGIILSRNYATADQTRLADILLREHYCYDKTLYMFILIVDLVP